MKSIALEDIYADPHKIDTFLASGESVEVVRDGRTVADLVPRKAEELPQTVAKRPATDYRRRFLEMWGQDAFQSRISVADEFAELRRQRAL